MGIDLKSGGRRIGHNVRRAPVSKNPYVKLLEKLFRYSVFPPTAVSCFLWDNREGISNSLRGMSM